MTIIDTLAGWTLVSRPSGYKLIAIILYHEVKHGNKVNRRPNEKEANHSTKKERT